MRVLDLDLDFFLEQDLVPKSKSGRLPDNIYKSWNAVDVKNFLDNNCGLEGKRIKGRIVVNHHEALLFWEELISTGTLRYPFEVVHVDAHADMGQGFQVDALYYISNHLLHLPVDKRKKYDKSLLNEGNYIAFALAIRFISQLTNVIHPMYHDDIVALYMKDYDPNSDKIEMKAMNSLNTDQFIKWEFDVISFEPTISFLKIPYTKFNDNGNFDFIVLSQSPHYTPKCADNLIPIISAYIENV